jgi:hypothetical protein
MAIHILDVVRLPIYLQWNSIQSKKKGGGGGEDLVRGGLAHAPSSSWSKHVQHVFMTYLGYRITK